MRRSFVSFVVVFFVVAACRTVDARQLFVNNTAGDDSANGTRPTSSDVGGPVRSLTRAMRLASPGDHIVVANTGVPYHESVSLSSGNQSGFNALPFVIEGNGAVLDGSDRVPDDAWQAVRGDLYKFRPAGGGNLRLFTASLEPLPQKPVDAGSGRLPQLAPGEWCAHGGYAYFQCEFGKLPLQYDLRYARLPVGLTLYHVHDVRIVDLTIQGFQRDGVNAHDGLLNVSLGGLILRGNGRCGLAVGGSSQIEAEGCLIGSNGQAEVVVEAPASLSLKNCDLPAGAVPVIARKHRGERLYVNGELQK